MTLRRLALASMAGIGIVLAFAGVASAHSGFASGVPEPGSGLGTTPGVVVLRFYRPISILPPVGSNGGANG